MDLRGGPVGASISDPLPESSIARIDSGKQSVSDSVCGSNLGSISNSCVSSDHAPVSSRCSVRLLHDIISKFSLQKVQLVRSIGFGGILHIPLLKQINLKFTTWLMSRVDELTYSLAIGDGSRIQFCKEDVASVFGIPCSGTSIFSNNDTAVVGSMDLSQRAPQADTIQFRSIKAAQAIVSRQHDAPLSAMEEDEFRAAFVVFVMSTLLAPCAKHDRVSDDFIHAIQIPASISSFDWAEYVLRRLLDAVAKLKADIANNVKAPYIYGCSLFLQVLYLDSIDLGMLSMVHDKFPRIRCFTSDRIRSMIAADSSFYLNGHDLAESRRIKLRKPDGLCYFWARSKALSNGSLPQGSSTMALWDFTVTMIRVLKIPPEAAGPIFMAASDFQRKLKSVVSPDALQFMDVLLHLIEPYMNGFSYKPSISLNSRPLDLCYLGLGAHCEDLNCCYHFSSIRAKRKSDMSIGEGSSENPSARTISKRPRGFHCSYSTPVITENALHRDNASFVRMAAAAAMLDWHRIDDVDISAIKAMAKFYLTITPVKATRCSNLNVLPQSVDDVVGCHRSILDCSLLVPRTPWELGFRCTVDSVKSSDILRKLDLVEDIDEPWIAHFCPKYIEVITRAVKEQFVGQAEFETELFDAVLRRFKQTDDELYASEGKLRWRHFVESDFMMSLLAGCFDIMHPVTQAHFRGRHIKYDVTACRIYRWVCFAWRMNDNTIVVYDPCLNTNAVSDLKASYERVVKLLKSAMAVLSSSFFPCWVHDWLDARIEIFNVVNCLPRRSGLMCLHFCCCFDGVNINSALDVEHIKDWSATILGEVSALAGNLGLACNYMG